MCTISTGTRWGDWLLHGPVGEAVFDTGQRQKAAEKKIKAAEMPVPAAPEAGATTEQVRATAMKRITMLAGQNALAQSRGGMLATSPLGVAGYAKGKKQTLGGA